jgi:Spy/CpxP family protein refolding chaperone
MGLARAAELNGYPGPMHVLELASELRLSASQETKTRELFARMRASAKELGAQLVAAEQALDAQFASRQVDPRSLVEALDRVASLQAKVRGVHLLAHLEQTGLLTSEQVALYAKLRGSSVGAGDPGGHGGHGHRSR